MTDEHKRQLVDHVAGATVRHRSPFAELPVQARRESPSPDFISEWIRPFYMVNPADSAFHDAFVPRAQRVDEALIEELLSFFNWRPRIVGAYFAAILRAESFVRELEPLLLRSDVCYAGRGYCLALASIDGPGVAGILERYLDHYLTMINLWFDQADALAALKHLDAVHGTQRARKYDELWTAFVANKPNWDLSKCEARFAASLAGLARCSAGIVR